MKKPQQIISLASASGWCAVFLLSCLACFDPATAAEPLFYQRPYDVITLDENNANAVLKVQPLDLPVRQLPPPQNRTGELEVELLERPGERFKVAWFNITSVKFFEEMVLAEAETHVAAGRFDEAFEYFQFLETKFPKTAGLKESFENYLWLQSGSEYKSSRFDQSLALMVELARLNPKRAGLSTAYARVTVKLVENRLAAGNNKAARGLLKNLATLYPEMRATSVAPFETQLQTKAASLVAQAQADLAAGKQGAAHRAASEALDIWPAVAGGQQLAQAIHAKYPVVSVGVVSPLASDVPGTAEDWASLRAGRLLQRTICERAPIGSPAAYRSPFGELVRGEDATRFTLQLRPGIRWPGDTRELTGHDIARCLLARAERGRPQFDPLWGEVFAGVDVRGLTEVQIEFQRPQIRPEAWLQSPLWTDTVAADGKPTAVSLGPYVSIQRTPQQVIFAGQSGYFAAETGQPAEVVERTYADSAAALRALRRGEVSVVDRLSPWDVRKLAGSKEYAVAPYALPTVHLLVPNPNRPLTANRTLRRAMLYALDREGILHRGLLDGQPLAGCAVLSGPFPQSAAANDPHGYAYNSQVKSRIYDPGTALVLAGLAQEEAGVSGAAPPELTLAHPPEPIARAACQSIARQLGALGLQIAPREVPAGAPLGNHDLLYVELPMREPLVDVWRLLGPQGITGGCSPAMQAALRTLAAAADGRQAATQLQAIHRLAAAELPVIPLWQTVEHLAYHKSVQGISPRPSTLYQDIEQWRVELRVPTE